MHDLWFRDWMDSKLAGLAPLAAITVMVVLYAAGPAPREAAPDPATASQPTPPHQYLCDDEFNSRTALR